MQATRTLVCPILVGRDDLLELADRRIREVAAGRGQLLLLAGEAGVGKTRLLGAIERRAMAEGFRSLRGGTYPSDLQVAAAILIDLSRAMLRQDDFEERGQALADRLDDPEPPGGGDAHRRRRLLVLDIADMLAKLADDGPTIVALEDLHWSDDLTLEILEAVARQLSGRPLLLVGTYRSDALFPRVPMRAWRARLVGGRQAEEIRLGRLTPADTAQMTTLLIETGLPVARDVAAAVHARTDGIPFHIEELLGVLADAGAASPGPSGVGDIREADVPETVEDAILARIEPCSEPAKQIAAAGAVIGRAFDLDLLSTVVGVSLDRLSAPLDELAEQFVLQPARTPWRYGFRHALICDAIYDHIPLADRRRLHGRTADAAVGTDVGSDAFLALHYERAGRRAEAYAAALRGAANAAAISSHREARELYATAIRMAPPELRPLDRARLLERLATMAAATDDNTAADEAFSEARASYLEAGDALAAAAVVGPHVAVRHLLGAGLEARADALRSALGEIAEPPALHASVNRDSARVRAGLLAGLSAAYMLDRRLEEAIGYAEDARAMAAAAGDAPTARNAAVTLGACFVFAGRMDEGWALIEDAIAASREAHLEAEAARGYRMIGSSASVLVEYELADRWLREGIDYAERVELWNHRHYMAAHLAHVLWATGDWAAADELARHALADGRGGITTRITSLHVIGFVAIGRAEYEVAEAALEEARQLGEQMAELQRLSPAVWGLAEMAHLRGDDRTAVRLSDEGLKASAAVRDAAYLFPFLVTGCRARLALGDPLSAERWVEKVAGHVANRAIPGTTPAIAHARGLVLLAQGSTGKARAALDEALEGWRERGRRWEGAWAAVDLARCALKANQRVDAGRLAAAARDDANQLGSPALVAAADEIIAAAARRGAAAEPWAPLTAREFAVARLVAEGHTNPEIAAALNVATKTVAAHVEHILAKLGAGRRAEIAAWVASIPVDQAGAPRAGRQDRDFPVQPSSSSSVTRSKPAPRRPDTSRGSASNVS